MGGKKIEDPFVFSRSLQIPDLMMPTYLCVCSTRKPPVVAIVTGCVLQTETCFVAFSHSPLGVGIEQVIVAEFIHAVVMSSVSHNTETVVSDRERKSSENFR